MPNNDSESWIIIKIINYAHIEDSKHAPQQYTGLSSLNCEESETHVMAQGVLQGSMLRPLLWSFSESLLLTLLWDVTAEGSCLKIEPSQQIITILL